MLEISCKSNFGDDSYTLEFKKYHDKKRGNQLAFYLDESYLLPRKFGKIFDKNDIKELICFLHESISGDNENEQSNVE